MLIWLIRQPRWQGLLQGRTSEDRRHLREERDHHPVGRGLRPPVLRPFHEDRDAVS